LCSSLGDEQEGEVPHNAAAARAEDVSGLPPAYITVGQADRFRDEKSRTRSG
jgi:acetyl esterase/lipase